MSDETRSLRLVSPGEIPARPPVTPRIRLKEHTGGVQGLTIYDDDGTLLGEFIPQEAKYLTDALVRRAIDYALWAALTDARQRLGAPDMAPARLVR